jgi:hypothetical protein
MPPFSGKETKTSVEKIVTCKGRRGGLYRNLRRAKMVEKRQCKMGGNVRCLKDLEIGHECFLPNPPKLIDPDRRYELSRIVFKAPRWS